MITTSTGSGELDALWDKYNQSLRRPDTIIAHWGGAEDLDRKSLKFRARGDWWGTLERLGVTLFLSREYEHFVLALNVTNDQPRVSFLALPHPSGVVVDRRRKRLFVAATRNPNQIFEFRPATRSSLLGDQSSKSVHHRPLIPVRSTFYPGSFYLHDLALIESKLLGTVVGQNAISVLSPDGTAKRCWWPRSVQSTGGLGFRRNTLQLNGIASGSSLEKSFFSASAAEVGKHYPGDRDFPVDGRGVIFSGKTREPCCIGLTRPHSPRLRQGNLWVNNSGYGEVGIVQGERLEVVQKMAGWTRGLTFCKDVVFVGTSRVLPKFGHYAPGLDVQKAFCGVHALDVKSGAILGSLIFPTGNQIFGLDWISGSVTRGFPARVSPARDLEQETALYYDYSF